MHPLLKPLHAPSADARFDAADALADQFEAGRVPTPAYPEVIAGLLELTTEAGAEANPDWQEALLNTLNHAMIRFTGDPKPFAWSTLIDALPAMKAAPLAEALPILSMSGAPGVRDIIIPYLQHSSARVKEAAGFALDELEMGNF